MIYLILGLGLLLRSLGLQQSLWLDEAAQAIESARPLSEQLQISGDFWPPLYHLLLHFWMRVSVSEVWMRLLSVIIGTVTIYITYLLATKLVNKKAGMLVAFLLSMSPFHIWYSQEVRPYALMTLFGVLATYFLINFSIYRYIATSILFLYTSYLAPFLLVAHGAVVYIFDRKSFKRWKGAFLVSVIFFLPWWPSFWQQLNIGQGLTQTLPGWSEAVSAPLVKVLPQVFIKFMIGRISFDNKTIYGALAVSLFILIGYLTYRSYKLDKTKTLKLATLLGLPIILAFVVSFWLPILAPQRVLFGLPFFYTLISLGIFVQKKSQLLWIGLFVIISFASLYLYWTDPRFQREQWRQSVVFVEENRNRNSLVLFAFPDTFAPWQWYSKNMVSVLALAPTFTVKPQELSRFRERIERADRLFFYHYLIDLTDPASQIPAYLNSLGFSEIEIRDFPGVGFISIYEKVVARN